MKTKFPGGSFLFVGGPYDGEWKQNYATPNVKVAITAEGGVIEYRYEAHRFVAGSFETLIYVEQHLSVEEAFKKLLAGYQSPRGTQITYRIPLPNETSQANHQ